MGSKPVADQYSWLVISSSLCLGIKYMYKPFQADFRISIARFGTRILPSGGWEHGPIASMSTSRPDNHLCQIPAVSTNTLDCSHSRSLDSRTSIVSSIVLTYQDFDGAWHREDYSSLVHIVDISCYNRRTL